MKFKVIKVIDGLTLIVSPNWHWGTETGDTIMVNGFDAPIEGQEMYLETKEKLEQLVLNKDIELRNIIRLTSGRLLCDIFFDDKNIKDYLSEFKVS